jgi:hypothetical protein
VETHQHDPTSEAAPDPWHAVSSEFSSLGDRLKDTYRKVASDAGPTEDEIKEAFATLAGAWDQVAASFATALNDPATRAHLKKAASSFAAALGTTITDLGDGIRGGSVPGEPGDETIDQGGARGSVVDGDGETPPPSEGQL